MMKNKTTKKDFVFVYEVKGRELESLFLIAAYLENKGYSVAIINAWESQFYLPEAHNAEVVVISACYSDASYDYFTGHVASFKKVVNMRWEQFLINYYLENLRDLYAFRETALHTRHICWGKEESNWASKEYGIKPDCLPVLGYLPLDFYRDELKSLMIPREELFKRYGLAPSKKTLLFVSSFAYINMPELQISADKELIKTQLDVTIPSQKTILEWFVRFLQDHSDCQIIYRYHPSETNNPEIQELVNKVPGFFAIADLSLRHWICASDKIYNFCSSSMVEMLASGKDVYLLRPIKLPHEIDYSIMEDASCISTFEEFEHSAMEKEIKNPPVSKAELYPWYDNQKTPAFVRIGEYLIKTYLDADYVCRPSNNNLFKRKTFYKLKKFIENTTLFKKLAYFCVSHMKENAFTLHLQEILSVEKYTRAMQQEGSYAWEKMMLNRFSSDEYEQYRAYREAVAKFCSQFSL